MMYAAACMAASLLSRYLANPVACMKLFLDYFIKIDVLGFYHHRTCFMSSEQLATLGMLARVQLHLVLILQ